MVIKNGTDMSVPFFKFYSYMSKESPLKNFIENIKKSTPYVLGKTMCEMICSSEEEIEKEFFLDVEYPEDNDNAIDILLNEGIVDDFDEVSRAFERLLVMRDAFYVRLGNWKPDWKESNDYWGIAKHSKEISIICVHCPGLFIFPTYESAEKFLEICQEDLELFFSQFR